MGRGGVRARDAPPAVALSGAREAEGVPSYGSRPKKWRPRSKRALGGFGFGVCAAAATGPLLLAGMVGQPGRGAAMDLSIWLGFLGLSLVMLQFALVARFRPVQDSLRADVLVVVHKKLGHVALVLILAHPATAVLADPGNLRLLWWPGAPWQARLGPLSVAATVAIALSAAGRRRFGLGYGAWQLLHGLLAVAAQTAALAHVLMVGHHVDAAHERALWVATSGAFLSLFLWTRVVKPLTLHRRPWRLEEVVPVRGGVHTLVLRPDGHGGLGFEPGQFAWLKVGRDPLALDQHPFSICSSAEQTDRLLFAVQPAGDFTSSVPSLRPGTAVHLDGPYGAFSSDREGGRGWSWWRAAWASRR